MLNQDKPDKSNKTALITGASSGLGYELSKLFAKDGYNLVLVARNKARLIQVTDELKEKYATLSKIIPKDLSIAASPEEIFAELQQDSIHIDILVNNAGVGVFGLFHETKLANELNMMQINMTSLVHLTKLFVRLMLKKERGKY